LLDGADVVLALPDPAVYSKMHIYSFLLALYRKTIPVFGFSSAFVDAGALTAVFSTPEQIAQQTVELTAQWLNDPGQAAPPPAYPRYYSVRVNRGVVKSLRLSVPDEQVLQEQLQASEREADP
jgi:putative ABC transport system substrate-binding protein